MTMVIPKKNNNPLNPNFWATTTTAGRVVVELCMIQHFFKAANQQPKLFVYDNFEGETITNNPPCPTKLRNLFSYFKKYDNLFEFVNFYCKIVQRNTLPNLATISEVFWCNRRKTFGCLYYTQCPHGRITKSSSTKHNFDKSIKLLNASEMCCIKKNNSCKYECRGVDIMPPSAYFDVYMCGDLQNIVVFPSHIQN